MLQIKKHLVLERNSLPFAEASCTSKNILVPSRLIWNVPKKHNVIRRNTQSFREACCDFKKHHVLSRSISCFFQSTLDRTILCFQEKVVSSQGTICTFKKHIALSRRMLSLPETYCTSNKHPVLPISIPYFQDASCTLMKHLVVRINILYFPETSCACKKLEGMGSLTGVTKPSWGDLLATLRPVARVVCWASVSVPH